ncbi:MAG: UDP-2,3-diacylglucosamine diphosphatase LpxI [Cyanobacteria bacterium REEB67]|nr:UDP-2,3-diacylglucosamine diphosphatase LpxI [Cyanobacteria bacterium REEB67]
MESDSGSLALISGEGKLPAILAQSAKARGFRVVALALSEDAKNVVSPHADKTFLIAPGQLGRNVGLAKKEHCDKVVFVGKVPKLNLLRQLHKLDWLAVKELSRLPNFNDDTIQFAVGDIMEAQGIKVLTQSEFLRHLFPEVGLITASTPSAAEYADIEYGMGVAREIARLDIGQTVVIKDRMILAVEAIEGTDEAIRRAVKLARGPVVVCKVSKPNQDQRFDIPTVGMNTLNSMLAENPKPGGVLAIEARETMVVERDEMIAFAQKHNISIVAAALPLKQG